MYSVENGTPGENGGRFTKRKEEGRAIWRTDLEQIRERIVGEARSCARKVPSDYDTFTSRIIVSVFVPDFELSLYPGNSRLFIRRSFVSIINE